MNQIFVGGIALIIAFILWSSKKQSKGSTFLKSQNDPFPKSNSTYSFVQKSKLINQKKAERQKNHNQRFLQLKPRLIQ